MMKKPPAVPILKAPSEKLAFERWCIPNEYCKYFLNEGNYKTCHNIAKNRSFLLSLTSELSISTIPSRISMHFQCDIVMDITRSCIMLSPIIALHLVALMLPHQIFKIIDCRCCLTKIMSKYLVKTQRVVEKQLATGMPY